MDTIEEKVEYLLKTVESQGEEITKLKRRLHQQFVEEEAKPDASPRIKGSGLSSDFSKMGSKGKSAFM